MKDAVQYAVITPVRDEAHYIDRTIDSMVRQTVPPMTWIIVDDGSTDGTGAMLDALAARSEQVQVIHNLDRGYRAAGSGVVEAFDLGYRSLGAAPWQFIVKLDGDLSFDPDYFERCFQAFAADARLGIAGGTVCRWSAGELVVDSTGDPAFHVRGATKIYRRECWEQIAPLLKAPGWDTVDEVKANLHGWTTRTLEDVPLVQHKPTGSADGAWKDAFKNGRADYASGYHPAFMLAKCMRRALRKRSLVGSAALLAGFCSGYLRKAPRVDDPRAIRYLRQQQLRRLLFRPSIYDPAARLSA